MLAIEIQNQVAKEIDNSGKELKMDIAQLSRGDRISYVARTELNMIPSQPETLMIYINKNKYLQQVQMQNLLNHELMLHKGNKVQNMHLYP